MVFKEPQTSSNKSKVYINKQYASYMHICRCLSISQTHIYSIYLIIYIPNYVENKWCQEKKEGRQRKEGREGVRKGGNRRVGKKSQPRGWLSQDVLWDLCPGENSGPRGPQDGPYHLCVSQSWFRGGRPYTELTLLRRCHNFYFLSSHAGFSGPPGPTQHMCGWWVFPNFQQELSGWCEKLEGSFPVFLGWAEMGLPHVKLSYDNFFL